MEVGLDESTRAVHAELVRSQLTALRARLAEEGEWDPAPDPVDRDARTLLEAAALTPDELCALDEVCRCDPRFRFVGALDRSTAIAMSGAAALEDSVWGTRDARVPEIVGPLQIFVRLLDGIVDEAPEVLAGCEGKLADVVRGGLDGRPPSLPTGDARPHVVVQALFRVAHVWTSLCREGEGWGDETVRGAFLGAVDEAMRAEFRSAGCTIDAIPPVVPTVRRAVRAKSTTVAWVVALIPVVVRGWPASVAPAVYRNVAGLFGTYVGWVDDMVDLLDDLEAGIWNDALLELHTGAVGTVPDTAGDVVARLRSALFDPGLRDRLVETGVAHHRSFFEALGSIGADPGPLARLITRAL